MPSHPPRRCATASTIPSSTSTATPPSSSRRSPNTSRDVGITSDFNVLFQGVLGAVRDYWDLTPEQRARRHMMKPPWWTRPMGIAEDRAASCFPRYLHSRMDELGCDVSVIYPSTGLAFLQLPSDELRQGACRALNRYHRDAFDGCTDRLIPVAAVPANTPAEAISELDYAVCELGFRAVVIPSYVPRPAPGYEGADAETKRWAFWLDTYGVDSDYDYDPFWQRCIDLGVSVGTHSQGTDIGFRRSPTNWIYNHIGHFAASGEALCKSLFLGAGHPAVSGAPGRHPRGRGRVGVQPVQRARRPLGEAQRQGHPGVPRSPTAGRGPLQRARRQVRPGRPGHQPTHHRCPVDLSGHADQAPVGR